MIIQINTLRLKIEYDTNDLNDREKARDTTTWPNRPLYESFNTDLSNTTAHMENVNVRHWWH